MADLAKLVVKLEAQTAKFQKDLDRAEKKVSRFSKTGKKSLDGLQLAFGALAVGGVTRKIIDATAKQERAFKQLEQGIKSTNQAVGFSAQELAKYASELQKATTFGDEDIIQAQSQLVTFTQITGQEFNKTIELAADLSTRFGIDLKSSVLQLGKALNDPVANLSALSRAGIQFSKDQQDLIKGLFNSGKQAEAQRVILKELETQFGGSARAARDTFGGALQALSNNFGDLLESKSGLNGAKESIEALNKVLSDPKTLEAADKLTSALIDGFSDFVFVLSQIPDFAKFLGETVAKAFTGGVDLASVTEDLAEKTSQLATQQGLLSVAIARSSNEQARYNAQLDPTIIQQRIDKLNEEIATINLRKAALEDPDIGGFDFRTKPEDSGTDDGSGSVAPPAFDATGFISDDDKQKLTDRAAALVDEVTPQIDKLRAKIVEAGELFATEYIGGEKYEQIKEFFLAQIDEIENKDILAFENKLVRLEEQFLTETELLQAQREERLAFIDDGLAKELISEEKAVQAKLKINKKYRDDKKKIEDKAAQAELKQAFTVAQGVLGVLSAFAGNSVKATKALAIAEGIINIAGGVSKALNNPYPANLGFAAAVAAQGAQLIATIKGTNLGSSGGAPTVSAGASSASSFTTPAAVSQQTPEEPEETNNAPSRQFSIVVNGDINSNDADRLIEDIRSRVSENDLLLIDPDSRNGQELSTSGGLI